MDKPIEFRRQARGYNREDVNSFISRENIRFSKLEESYAAKLKDAEQQISDLNTKIDEFDSQSDKICQLESELSALKSEIEKSKEVIAEKDAIIEGLKNALDGANEKLDIANGIIDDYKSAPKSEAVEYSDDIIEKAEKFDAVYDKVDEILEFAKSEAEKIINDAIQTRQTVNKKSSANFKNEISERSGSIIEDMKRSIRRQFKSSK